MSVATAPGVDIGSMIYKMKTATGERACIAGTSTSVKSIAIRNSKGESPDEIQSDSPHLTLAQVYAALAYYHANRAEIDAAIERDMAAGQRLIAKGLAR